MFLSNFNPSQRVQPFISKHIITGTELPQKSCGSLHSKSSHEPIFSIVIISRSKLRLKKMFKKKEKEIGMISLEKKFSFKKLLLF